MKPLAGVSLFLLSFLFSLPSTAQSVLRLNEFMVVNQTTVQDPDFGSYAAWIELHNPGPQSIDLTGYFLTNDVSQPGMWPIPVGTSITPGGYVVFWADELNIGLHTNFSLSSSEGTLALFDPSTTLVDQIPYSRQFPDISFGLLGNTPGAFRYFEVATPGAPNTSVGFQGVTDPVVFSQEGGFYTSTQTVTLSTAAGQGTIHYTVDGSEPMPDSPAYVNPLPVSSTIVLRAAVFQEGFLPGPVSTHTYLINESTALPVFSISTAPDNLFSNNAGIYVAGTNGVPGNCSSVPRNWNQDWEKPVHVEFFESDRERVVSQQAGLKIYGGCSRSFDQKSLSLHARPEYGAASFTYRFFDDKPIDAFSNLVLRNSGQDWFRTMFRDGLVQHLIKESIDIDHLAYRPAVVFINGAYWGIHNLRELPDAAYLEENRGVDENQIDLLEGRAAPLVGSAILYNEMLTLARANDLSDVQSFAVIEALMDVEQYIDYQTAEIYIANADWPSTNIRYWRSRVPVGRWRWILFDTDFSFAGNENGLFASNTLEQATADDGPDWPNPPWSTELLRELLENESFEHRFVQRLASHASITFEPTYVSQVIDSFSAAIALEVPRHKARWPESIGFNTPWDAHIASMRQFAEERPENIKAHVGAKFGYTEMFEVDVRITGQDGGRVFVAGVPMRGTTFTGTYFAGAPLELKAVPGEGYLFKGWQGDVNTTDEVIETTGGLSIEAVFEASSTPVEDAPQPFTNRLHQNYPNPFRAETVIPFELSSPSPVSIRVVDLLGREVFSLEVPHLPSGEHIRRIPGNGLAAGVYVYEVKAGESFVDRRTMIRIP